MPRHRGGQRGAAVVDVVLVLVVLVPLVLGILQLALVMFVRNTLAAAASEGARLAATSDRGPADGVALTRQQLDGVVSGLSSCIQFQFHDETTPAVKDLAPRVLALVEFVLTNISRFGLDDDERRETIERWCKLARRVEATTR